MKIVNNKAIKVINFSSVIRLKIMSVLIIILFVNVSAESQTYHLSSPDGRLKMDVQLNQEIQWSVSLNNMMVIGLSPVSLVVDDLILGQNPILISKKTRAIDEKIFPVVPYKSNTIRDQFNELVLNFKGNYSLVFRAYNDGVAYRFQTSFKKEITVNTENLRVNFAPGTNIFFSEEASFMSHYEPAYQDTTLASISEKRFCSLPVLVTSENEVRVLITDADIFDYPNMFLFGTGSNSLTARFPEVVLETALDEREPDLNEKITKEANYIATTNGTRSFPWRAFVITEDDGRLVESEMAYKLSRSNVLEDTHWIKPGKASWDWWNANNIYGVDFRSGLNTASFKYYIDFAAKYHLEYLLMDAYWSKTMTDLSGSIPEINLKEVAAYGKSRNVGVILWVQWKSLDQDMEKTLDQFSQWGIKGVKVDFMQRTDQGMVNYYEKVARECAKRQLVVDFHGSYKPSGLQRAYPNILNFEGVKGGENNKFNASAAPEHNVTLPFTRMVAGPMDYTPGAMINANRNDFRVIHDRPMSMGTRCHQVAMYVVYESPLQMLADSPSNYYQEHETTEFISKIPVTWDETHVLKAKVSDYILLARKKENKWYLGAMTDWTPREMEVDFSFLGDGSYSIEIMQDGVNADRIGNDYKKIIKTVNKGSKLTINLAAGGGWAAIVNKIKD